MPAGVRSDRRTRRSSEPAFGADVQNLYNAAQAA
jgi:hypothetical protein